MSSPISLVVPDISSDAATAFCTLAAESCSPRNSSIIAAEMIAALGSAFPVPDDVGGRAVYRLEERRTRPGRIEVGRGGPSDPAGDRAGEIGEDVAEEVVGDDHVVATGVGDEMDARRVDVVVRRRDIGILGRDGVERAARDRRRT